MKLVIFFTVIVTVGIATLAAADVPQIINYQGRLTNDTGEPVADGSYTVTFSLYTVDSGGSADWSSGPQSVTTTDGLFTYKLGSNVGLDSDLFRNNSELWLGIKVDPDTDEIDRRTKLTSVPYAYQSLRADTASYALATPGGSSKWSVIDSVLYTNSYWGIARGQAGNSLRGDSTHTAVNLGTLSITGSLVQLDGAYQTVSGGWANGAHAKYSTVSGGLGNNAYGDYSVISGGQSNVAVDEFSTVGGGNLNRAWGRYSVVVGGDGNSAVGEKSIIGGGQYNDIDGNHSVIGGGWDNNVTGNHSVIGGGFENVVNASFAGVLSGNRNVARNQGVICGGKNNSTGTYGLGFVGGGEGNYADQFSAVVGGTLNSANGYKSFIGGGTSNSINIAYSVIGGGVSNEVVGNGNDSASVIAGGRDNKINDTKYSTIGGGRDNFVGGEYSSVLGGHADSVMSDYSYLFGIRSILTQDSTFMVDMPHIRFGDEATGYEVPTEDGTAGQVMATDGNGQLSWTTVPSGGSGSVFTRWGNAMAPVGTDLLYSGFAYASADNYSSFEPIVIMTGDPGPTVASAGWLYPLQTDNPAYSPPTGITWNRWIRAAICYADAPVVTVWGTHTPPVGWSSIYSGYAMGTKYDQRGGVGPICVDNLAFDATYVASGQSGVVTGLRVRLGAPGDESLVGKYVKCVVCAKSN